jgi:hypothetical protein
MRATLRVAVATLSIALSLVLVLATDVLAKGEQASAVIGPIGDIAAGTPTKVTATLAMNGQAITSSGFNAMLDFYDPVTDVAMDFPLRYDGTTEKWVATVTLPYKGRWLVGALMRQGSAGWSEPFGTTNGTRAVTVNPAPTAPVTAEASSPLSTVALGAAAASAAWLLGIALYALRRRRNASQAPQSVGERVPA